MERWSSCPQCERPVKLTDAELEAKRGFCARCDAEFEIKQAALRDAPSPFRSSDRPELVPTQPRPPSIHLQDESRGTTSRLVIRPTSQGWGVALAQLGIFAVVSLIFLWMFGPIVTGVIAGLLVLRSVLVRALAREEFEIRDGALWYRSINVFPVKWDRIPLGALRRCELERPVQGNPHLRIDREGAPPLRVAESLRHDEAAMAWAKRWLDQRVDTAVAGEVETAPPRTLPAGND